MATRSIVTEGFGSFGTTALVVVEGYSSGTSAVVTVTTQPDQRQVSGGRRRPPQGVHLPQQIVDDLAALYRTIYAGRQALDPGLSRRVAELVGFFAESFDGRLPPPEAVHFRDMAEYPAIDLSVLTEAADAIIARGQQVKDRPKPEPMADWMVAAARQGYAVDRAMARMKRDAEIAAARAADQEEEDAIMALLTIL